VTATLSVDALQESVAVVWVVALTTSFVGTDGIVVSAAHALVDALTEAFVERLPAASAASTARV
jgi:hypothetical protein